MHRWNQEEVDYLRKNYTTQEINKTAKKLGLTYQQVVSKASNLKINRKKETGEIWSEKEDRIIEEHFNYAPKDFIMNLLPKRTWPSIYQRGNKTHKMIRITQDRYSVDYNFFSEWTPNSSYLYGFILADGYIKYKDGPRNESSLQIELGGVDRDFLIKISNLLDYKGVVRESNRNTAVLHIANVKIIEDLKEKGMPTKNKTFTSSWPKTLPMKYSRDFIRGVFDGDGSVYESGGCRTQFLGTEELLIEIKKQLPVDSSTNSVLYRGKSGADVYCLQFNNQKSKEIYRWLYEDAEFCLLRKKERFQEILWPN